MTAGDKDLVIPPTIGVAHRVRRPGTALYGSEVVLSGVLRHESQCPLGLLASRLSLDVKTVRYDTLKVAKRLEAELGEEQAEFIEGEPSDWDLLPLPEGSFTVGIDGGYVRNWFDKKHNFEVIVGKSIIALQKMKKRQVALAQTLWICANAGYKVEAPSV